MESNSSCYSPNDRVTAKKQEEYGSKWMMGWSWGDRQTSWKGLRASGRRAEGALTQTAHPELASTLAIFVRVLTSSLGRRNCGLRAETTRHPLDTWRKWEGCLRHREQQGQRHGCSLLTGIPKPQGRYMARRVTFWKHRLHPITHPCLSHTQQLKTSASHLGDHKCIGLWVYRLKAPSSEQDFSTLFTHQKHWRRLSNTDECIREL